METKKFISIIFILHILAFLCYGAASSYYDDEYYKEIHPHYKVRKRNIISDFFLPRVRNCGNPIYKEASYLKQLGTTTAMYFIDGTTSKYPSNPQELDIDPSILETRKNEPKLQLHDDWEAPDNWQDFNTSNAAYAFLRTPGETYTGSSLTPLFIIKPNYRYNPNCRQVVFEDGHLECVSKEDTIALWKKAGVWNDKEN